MAKRSITIAGHRTSISLEEPFWAALAEIAREDRRQQAALVGEIDRTRPEGTNLSSALRVYVLQRARAAQPPP